MSTQNLKKIKIGDILKLEYGKNLPSQKRTPGDIPVYGSNGIVGTNGNSLVNTKGIIVGRKGSIGKLEWSDEPFWPIDTTYYITESDMVDLKWIYFMLQTLELGKMNRGTGVPGLNRDDVYKLEISLPARSVQKKIASELEIVDNAISITDQTIQKTEELKQGLMQELLTKGIGHTDFKKTEIGSIPENWEVELLDHVAKRGSGHTPNKTFPNYWNGGIKWISLSDTFRLDRVYISQTSKQISQEGIEHSSAVMHPEGVVVLSRDAGIGKSAITTEPMAVSQHFIAWRCGERLNNLFLYYILQHRKPVFEQIASGSTIKTIGLSFFKKIKIPLPPIEEQKKIADLLYTLDQKIELERKAQFTLRNTKSGIMKEIFGRKADI